MAPRVAFTVAETPPKMVRLSTPLADTDREAGDRVRYWPTSLVF